MDVAEEFPSVQTLTIPHLFEHRLHQVSSNIDCTRSVLTSTAPGQFALVLVRFDSSSEGSIFFILILIFEVNLQ